MTRVSRKFCVVGCGLLQTLIGHLVEATRARQSIAGAIASASCCFYCAAMKVTTLASKKTGLFANHLFSPKSASKSSRLFSVSPFSPSSGDIGGRCSYSCWSLSRGDAFGEPMVSPAETAGESAVSEGLAPLLVDVCQCAATVATDRGVKTALVLVARSAAYKVSLTVPVQPTSTTAMPLQKSGSGWDGPPSPTGFATVSARLCIDLDIVPSTVCDSCGGPSNAPDFISLNSFRKVERPDESIRFTEVN